MRFPAWSRQIKFHSTATELRARIELTEAGRTGVAAKSGPFVKRMKPRCSTGAVPRGACPTHGEHDIRRLSFISSRRYGHATIYAATFPRFLDNFDVGPSGLVRAGSGPRSRWSVDSATATKKFSR